MKRYIKATKVIPTYIAQLPEIQQKYIREQILANDPNIRAEYLQDAMDSKISDVTGNPENSVRIEIGDDLLLKNFSFDVNGLPVVIVAFDRNEAKKFAEIFYPSASISPITSATKSRYVKSKVGGLDTTKVLEDLDHLEECSTLEDITDNPSIRWNYPKLIQEYVITPYLYSHDIEFAISDGIDNIKELIDM